MALPVLFLSLSTEHVVVFCMSYVSLQFFWLNVTLIFSLMMIINNNNNNINRMIEECEINTQNPVMSEQKYNIKYIEMFCIIRYVTFISRCISCISCINKWCSSTSGLLFARTPHEAHIHWLPIHKRIHFKVATLTYKVLSTQQQAYLYNLISYHQSSRLLRSSSQSLLHFPG